MSKLVEWYKSTRNLWANNGGDFDAFVFVCAGMVFGLVFAVIYDASETGDFVKSLKRFFKNFF